MIVILQICVIFLVLLIAYWWANQGFLSSILHFIAVACAGAIALAFWEQLVMGVLLRDSGFDNYAWGMTLIILFVALLLIFRVTFDKLVPGNVFLPQWVNLTFGAMFGFGSGVITVGMLLLGVGFTQSSSTLLGMKFEARTTRGVQNDHGSGVEYLWLPAHEWTVQFYEFLSVGSFYPEFTAQPLKMVNPRLDDQAFSLIRDSFSKGTARVSIPPDAVSIIRVSQGPERFYIDFSVTNKAYDKSQQFICSTAQIRLLAYKDGNVSRGPVSIGIADYWKQKINVGGGGGFQDRRLSFDDTSHYITSVPGQPDANFQVEFPIGNGKYQIRRGHVPVYFQIKGARIKLPAASSFDKITIGTAGLAIKDGKVSVNITGGKTAAPADIAQRNDIRPITTTVNRLVGMYHENRYLTSGKGTFKYGRRSGARASRILGVAATEGTRIIQVDVSRSSTASIYPAADEAPNSAPILVDSEGNPYFAKGFILEDIDDIRIELDPSNLIESVSQLPRLPTSNSKKMRLFFEVTQGVTIISFRIGEIPVANCNVKVTY